MTINYYITTILNERTWSEYPQNVNILKMKENYYKEGFLELCYNTHNTICILYIECNSIGKMSQCY